MSQISFKITSKDKKNKARAGVISTPHGDIETPIFVPVGTQGSVKAVDPNQLHDLGAQVVLANTYHLHLRPGEDLIKKFGGLAKFMSWNGPTMTDSGNTVRTVWIQNEMNTQFSSAIHLKGYLYCIDGNVGGGHLKCLDVQSGQVQWTRNTGFGSLISAAGRLIVLNEKGTLTILEADPSGYREIAAATDLLKAKCWNAPVLSNGVLYLRNNGGVLLALDVRS